MPDRPYQFLDLTIALCSTCLRRVEAKVVERDGRVYLHKRCPEHGVQNVLISSDAEYYKLCRRTIKPGQMPLKFNTPIKYGCPYDCGLCPDHEQHGCLTIVEVTDQCNLRCPVCYAESGPERRGEHRPLAVVERMLDAVVANEGEPDVVQISGGEPTEHPDFWAILDAARRRPIKHLMLNTNGVRIASEPGFAERLTEYLPGFEVYLQFDSLRRGPLMELRGADLRGVRERAVGALNRAGLSTNLVVTLKRGLNDDEVGAIIDWALTQPCVRGVTFQPVQHAGRVEGYDPGREGGDRLTLADVRRAILEQTDVFGERDVVPVPCHPDCLAMAYALKPGSEGGRAVPLTGLVDPQTLLEGEGNTIVYERHPELRRLILDMFSTAASPEGSAATLRQLLCCLPQVPLSANIGYDRIFRVIVMKFMDAEDMDVRSVKKTCVHFAHPPPEGTDGRVKLIPFDTYNLLYRPGGGREAVLAGLRGERPRDLVPLTLPAVGAGAG